MDRIMGIYSLDKIAAEVKENPYKEGELSGYISGIVNYGEEVLNIIDIDKLLSSSRMNAFSME